MFSPADAEAISKIRLTARRTDENFVAWQPEKLGMFSVPTIIFH
jgi:hypothetical protein